MNESNTRWQKRLAFFGASLFFIGGLNGILVANAMEHGLAERAHVLLASHLNALLGCFWMVAVGWTLKWVDAPAKRISVLCSLTILAAWANWLVTLIKAYLDVRGVAYTSDGANNAIFLVLTLTVVLPTLVASFLWALGLWKGLKGDE
jgi:hydroxylaminobenzene mutase